MRPSVVCVATLGLLVSAGCKDDDGGDDNAEGMAEETGDGDGDASGDGDGDGDDPSAWSFAPLYAAPNLDDDDASGQRDWLQVVFPGDEEVHQLVIPAAAYAAGDSIRLSLAGDTAGVRFWLAGEHVLATARPSR